MQCKMGHTLEMVRYEDAVTADHQYEVIYGLSNRAISSDHESPLRSFTYRKPYQM